MSISVRFNNFLEQQGVSYNTINHLHSNSSASSAHAAHISPHQLAKAVVLEDHDGKKIIAVLPTDNKISLQRLNDRYRATFHLMPEQQVYSLFWDCENGAIPPAGEAYHLNTIYDDSLLAQTDIYLEGGDHQTLVHLNQKEFAKLIAKNPHASFSRQSVF